MAAYEARGCARDNLLMQIPATWAGLEAVKVLESECIQCQVVHVFSFSQAVAAVNHKASVIVPCIRRINLWYDQHPGAIRDPKVCPLRAFRKRGHTANPSTCSSSRCF